MLTKFRDESCGRTVESTVRRAVMRHILHSGGFMIPEVAAATGYSMTTVAKYVAGLLSEGALTELEHVNLHARGRRAVRYGLVPDACYFLGIDMKVFGLDIALMNVAGEIIRTAHHPDFRFANTHEALDVLCENVNGFVASLEGIDTRKIACANLNLSGRVDSRRGTSASVFDFEEMRDTPLADMLGERLGIRVFIENDTKAMTYGEYMSQNRYREYRNLLFVNISWGLGLGIIIDGRLYYGKDGYSGELGHLPMYDNNILCHCGKKGCVETEVSGRAVHRKLLERIVNGESSALSGAVKSRRSVTTDDILDAARHEDPLCIELLTQAASELGRHMAGLLNLLNPEIIVLGGSLSQAEPFCFLQPAELAIRKYALRLISRHVPIVTSALGAEAGVTGACLLARSRTFGNL